MSKPSALAVAYRLAPSINSAIFSVLGSMTLSISNALRLYQFPNGACPPENRVFLAIEGPVSRTIAAARSPSQPVQGNKARQVPCGLPNREMPQGQGEFAGIWEHCRELPRRDSLHFADKVAT